MVNLDLSFLCQFPDYILQYNFFLCAFSRSLPEVPNLEEVANLSFQTSGVDTFKQELERIVSNIGRVSRIGPVQISCVDDRPGALLVQWEEVDAERTVDISCYRESVLIVLVRFQTV